MIYKDISNSEELNITIWCCANMIKVLSVRRLARKYYCSLKCPVKTTLKNVTALYRLQPLSKKDRNCTKSVKNETFCNINVQGIMAFASAGYFM